MVVLANMQDCDVGVDTPSQFDQPTDVLGAAVCHLGFSNTELVDSCLLKSQVGILRLPHEVPQSMNVRVSDYRNSLKCLVLSIQSHH